jgi:ATP-binding cassette subfamily F protein 3
MELQLKNLEKSIAEKEDYLLKLQEQLCLEEIYSNPIESNRVNKEIKSVETDIEELYQQWEELA